MTDPRRLSSGQRPLMGPPETPSRVMQASPNLFPSLQFSPELFSNNGLSPASAPAYPQHNLFWDGSGVSGVGASNLHQYQDPFGLIQDGTHHSYASQSTIVPNFHNSQQLPPQHMYDLPTVTRPLSTSFVDGGPFPMSFSTSPRVPSQHEDPGLFLSSPARRFGTDGLGSNTYSRKPVPDRPAYYHQIEESRREQEIKRTRKPDVQHASVTRSVLEALRRPISPAKDNRPGLKRSLTHSGLGGQQHLRHQSQVAFNDANSTTSTATTRSNRTGRSSPLKFLGDGINRSTSSRRSGAAKRSSLSLAIDENGVAKTVVTRLASEEDMDVDEDSDTSSASAIDDTDFHILRSQDATLYPEDDDAPANRNSFNGSNNRHSKTNSYSTMASSVSARFPTRTSSVNSAPYYRKSDNGPGHTFKTNQMLDPMMEDDTAMQDPVYHGDAQQALKNIIQDRSRSASTQDDSASTRNSVQFHSSPPVIQSQFGTYNASPTTITDPDLGTPSTDRESYISSGSTRCVCNSSNPDSNAMMIQCDSCTKWLHIGCVGIDNRRVPEVYICAYCAQTPMRHGRLREPLRSSLHTSASPLAHKSQRQR